jgi:hypothetical protein
MLQVVWVSYVYAFYGTEHGKGMAARKKRNGKKGGSGITKYIAIELQNRHPASSRHMDGPDDYNLAGPNSIYTDAPPRIWTTGIYLKTL